MKLDLVNDDNSKVQYSSLDNAVVSAPNNFILYQFPSSAVFFSIRVKKKNDFVLPIFLLYKELCCYKSKLLLWKMSRRSNPNF